MQCGKPLLESMAERYRKRGTFVTFQELDDGSTLMRVTTEIKIKGSAAPEDAGKRAANRPDSSPYTFGSNPDVDGAFACPRGCQRKRTRNSLVERSVR